MWGKPLILAFWGMEHFGCDPLGGGPFAVQGENSFSEVSWDLCLGDPCLHGPFLV